MIGPEAIIGLVALTAGAGAGLFAGFAQWGFWPIFGLILLGGVLAFWLGSEFGSAMMSAHASAGETGVAAFVLGVIGAVLGTVLGAGAAVIAWILGCIGGLIFGLWRVSRGAEKCGG
ncbi:hypothetical protein [Gemmobacter serpentinus]|uniref:hypothetical protein n=1 Tax=Gemmobacter serpentinus TaxID=2652247 RepID=UPI00124E5EF8|nr:hypothetical protein [Gemmobacter serpentinus]